MATLENASRRPRGNRARPRRPRRGRHATASLAGIALTLVFPAAAAAGGEDPPRHDGKDAEAPPVQEEKPGKERTKDGELTALDRVVVTATRTEEDVFDAPRSVTIVTGEELRRENALSALDTLDDKIGIWVEKRTSTASDPVLRGFSGGNVLALIDGNTLTTMWGEGGFAGDDMYGKVDPESVARIEVVRGPASVLYGSHALGGVIHFLTRKPPLDYPDSGYVWGGRGKGVYQSAANYGLLRLDQWGAWPWLRYRIGGSLRDVDDVRGGGDDGVLSPSGGEDKNVDGNAEIRLGGGHFLDVSGQSVHRAHLARFYRPTQDNFNTRNGLSVGWRAEDAFAFADHLEWRVYHQDKKDVRRWLGTDQRGVARWKTWTSDLQWTKTVLGAHRLTAGLHYERDDGESPDDEQFTITTAATGTQKASPDSIWQNGGAYLQDELELGRWATLVGSARYDTFRFEAQDNLFWTIPGSTALENLPTRAAGVFTQGAVTGGLAAVVHVREGWNLVGSWYRGFRLFAPNFGLRQLGFGILAPNELLDPVRGDTFEAGLRARHDFWSGAVTAYTTLLHDWQAPVPGSYQGQTAIDLDGQDSDGDGSPIDKDESIWVVGQGSATIYGVEAEGDLALGWLDDRLDTFHLGGGVMWNYGKETFAGRTQPLRHTHPARALLKLRWQDPDPVRQGWFEVSGDFVDAFDRVSQARLNGDVGFLNDPQDKTSGLLRPYGLPGYSILDLRGGWNLRENVALTIALENALNKRYRPAHSRMDAAGRNLVVAVEIQI